MNNGEKIKEAATTIVNGFIAKAGTYVICALSTWTLYTVHKHSIDLAEIKMAVQMLVQPHERMNALSHSLDHKKP